MLAKKILMVLSSRHYHTGESVVDLLWTYIKKDLYYKHWDMYTFADFVFTGLQEHENMYKG